MAKPGSRSVVQLVVVLVLTGAARSAWHLRTAAAPVRPGTPAEVGALSDSAARLAEAEARRTRPLALGERLDPNRAPEEELDRLPGVGPATAAAVAAARDTLPFASVEDLLRVRGVGPATLDRMRPHLALGSAPVAGARRASRARVRPPPGRGERGMAVVRGHPGSGIAGPGRAGAGHGAAGAGPPVDLNRAGAAELQSLSGVGPVLAERIVAWRIRHGPFATVESLLEVKGVGPATLARLRPRLRVR